MEPRQTPTEARPGRAHEIEDGGRLWPWAPVLTAAATLVAIGAMVDLDAVWLAGLVAVAAAGLAAPKQGRSWSSGAGRRGARSVAVVIVLALAAHVAVQYLARSLGWPAPNTWAAVAAAMVVVAARSLQALVERARGDRIVDGPAAS